VAIQKTSVTDGRENLNPKPHSKNLTGTEIAARQLSRSMRFVPSEPFSLFVNAKRLSASFAQGLLRKVPRAHATHHSNSSSSNRRNA